MNNTFENVRETLGKTDIYVIDQILRARLTPGMKILDAGCGSGRNLRFFLKSGFDIYANDENSEALESARALASELFSNPPTNKFVVASIDNMPFEDSNFDAVICNAVLHFAKSEQHFDQMLDEIWRVLKPGGLLFTRIASSIGIENEVQPLENGWFQLPDGSKRYLVNAEKLKAETKRLGAVLLDPIKTTLVDSQRSMTTWVVEKPSLLSA